MENNQNPVEKVGTIFDKYQDKFIGSFHNLLWQILVNECRDLKKKDSCFSYDLAMTQIGIADRNTSGYTPTSTTFKDEVPPAKRKEIIDDLNRLVFGLEPEDSMLIVITGMFPSKKQYDHH